MIEGNDYNMLIKFILNYIKTYAEFMNMVRSEDKPNRVVTWFKTLKYRRYFKKETQIIYDNINNEELYELVIDYYNLMIMLNSGYPNEFSADNGKIYYYGTTLSSTKELYIQLSFRPTSNVSMRASIKFSRLAAQYGEVSIYYSSANETHDFAIGNNKQLPLEQYRVYTKIAASIRENICNSLADIIYFFEQNIKM